MPFKEQLTCQKAWAINKNVKMYGIDRGCFILLCFSKDKLLFQAEEVDLNAAIHGNWTLENAKSKLHMFMQSRHIRAEYNYKSVGPDHNRYKNHPKFTIIRKKGIK